MSRPKGFKHSTTTKNKISKNNSGVKSSQWKGDDIKYGAIHAWISLKYGRANRCENSNCKGICTTYDWALKHGMKYERRRDCFMQLCRSCHQYYDMTDELRLKLKLSHKKYYGCKVSDCGNEYGARGYCSHHYNVIYRKLFK
jgi:hypothetical protein